MRVAALDLAILTAFCRPYFDEGRFRSPSPNNKILEELADNGVYLDLDSLRTHLRNLYAKFGVEDGLTPAEKRARLAELVYEAGVIPGWGADQEQPPSTSATPPTPPPASDPPAEAPPGEPRPQRPADERPSDARLPRLVREHGAVGAGLAALVLGVLVVALVVGLPAGDDRGPAAKRSRIAVIEPSSMRGAEGTVTYCTGEDVATSSDGRTQHETAVQAFNDEFGPRLHANLRQLPADATQQYEQFKRLQEERSGDCDVFYSDVVWTADFAYNKWLLDLSPYARPRMKRFVPAMREAAQFGGRVWGVPKQADAALLYYNEDSVDRPPRTWQELYEQAAKGGGKRFRYQAADYEGLTVNFLEVAYAIGAEEIVTPGGKANINQLKALVALQFMVEGIKTGALPREIVNQKESQSLRAFGTGRADFMRNWPYAYAALQDPEYEVAGDVGVAPLPSWERREPVTVLGGHLLVISAFTDTPAAALKLVDFLASTEVVKQDATEFSLAPALTALWDDFEVQQALPAFDDLKSAVFDAKSRPITPRYPAISAVISKNVNRALRGDLAPVEALDAANYEVQRILDGVYRRG